MTGPSDVEALVARGEHRAAADLCQKRGQLARAQHLLEQLFDYEGAGQLAEAQSDTLGALELYLRGGQTARAEALRRRLMAELHTEIPRALALFEDRGFYLQAAELAESIGRLEQAAELYIRGNSHAHAGALLERIGRARDAGRAYETALRGDPDDPAVNLGLGRVLQRFGRHAEAVPLLSRAQSSDDPRDRLEAGERIAYSFFRLRLVEAGRTALEQIGRPRTLDVESFMVPFESERLSGGGDAGDGGRAAPSGGALEGRYRLSESVAGPFGASYLADDLLEGQRVMLNFVPGTAEDNRSFYEELQRLAKPPCRGHVRLLEINPSAGFVARRAPDGHTLLHALESPAPPNALAVRGIAVQVFEALEAAHRRGVLHGALSPAAIEVNPAGVVAVSHWGLRQVERSMATQTAGAESALAYRAPEATLGHAQDFRADLYSLAAVVVRALVGDAPRMGHGSGLSGDWPPPFERFFAQALSADPLARHETHDLFRRQLEALPWASVANRRPPLATASAAESAQGVGPRFVAPGGVLPTPGQVATVRDTLLDREVRYLALPAEELRPLSLIDRLDQLASPECPGLQDVLLSTDEAILLELLTGRDVAALVASSGPLDPLVVLDAATDLLGQVAAAHGVGVGLGTVSPELVRFDGEGFRAPIETTLLVKEGHDEEAMGRDARGFWGCVLVALGGPNAGQTHPSHVFEWLRDHGLLSRGAAPLLEAAMPTQTTSLATTLDWFTDLTRAVQHNRDGREGLRRMVALARADRDVNEAERAILQARAEELGLVGELDSWLVDPY